MHHIREANEGSSEPIHVVQVRVLRRFGTLIRTNLGMSNKYLIYIVLCGLFSHISGAQENAATAASVQTPGAQNDDAAVNATVNVASPAYPCENDPRFSEFDFWVGEWNVHVANGNLAGQNVIVAEQRGCVLIEKWNSATGGTGTSINYLDKTSGEWVQIWNDASGNQINIRGGLTEDGMLLEGTIHYIGSETTAPFRGLWTELPDGRVRQYFEQSNDGGETWAPWFEGFYSRRSDKD